jgi:hypothetical protein
MKEQQDSTKLEFLTVQRFFNVRGFNPKAKNSLELYDFMKSIKESLTYDLKMKTVSYMMDNKDAIMHDQNVMSTSYTDDAEYFNLYVKIGEQTICHRIFDGKLFPPKVRYTVDVRPFLKDILRGLTDIFSDYRLTYEYLDYRLV